MNQNGMNGFNNAPSWNAPQYPSNNQPFQNSYYPTYSPPSYYQPVQQIKSNRTIPGRIVASEEEITPNDVPMDGYMYPFIMQDGSCVFGKRWNSNGRIETTIYVKQQAEDEKSETKITDKEVLEQIVGAFGALNGRLEKIEKLLAPLAEETASNI